MTAAEAAAGESSLHGLRALDFVVIGAARSGTTSLFQHLREHPAVYVPAAKELPYFSDRARMERGWGHFVREFYGSAPESSLWGKVSPQYMESPEVPARMAQLMPRVRLVALLRNPIDRALSHYRFLVRRGADPLSFEDSFFGDKKGAHYYRMPGEYSRVLSGFTRHFSPKQLLILFTDELQDRPLELLHRLQQHLELSQPFSPTDLQRRHNVGGRRTRFPWLVPLLRRTAPLKALWRRLPEASRRSFSRWYFFEVAPIPEPPTPLDPELRKRLRQFYRGDVMRLAEMVDSPLPWREFFDQE